MNIKNIHKTATNEQEFFAYSPNNTKYKCKWIDVIAGIFEVLGCRNPVTDTPLLLNLKDVLNARVEAI